MAVCSLKQGLSDLYPMSIVFTYYLLSCYQDWIFWQVDLSPCCVAIQAPVLNLCSLSVILHSNSYVHSTFQWAVELVWLPCTTFCRNSCLPPGNSLQEGALISLCVCFKMNHTVVEHVVYWLDSMISSTHSDRQIALADHFVFLWVSALCGTLP